MQNFVYLIGDPKARECVVVDPAWEIDTIVETGPGAGHTITGALVTHTHQDHVGGSSNPGACPAAFPARGAARAPWKAKVYVHKAEREFLKGFARIW